jgi:ATP-binding cassette subfamily B protein
MSQIEEKDFSDQFEIETWKKIFKYLWTFKKHVITGGIFAVGIAILDVAFPLMIRYALDNFVAYQTTDGLIQFSLIFVGMLSLQAFNIYSFIRHAGAVEVKLSYLLRKESFEHLQTLSTNYFNKTPVGWFMARLTSDSKRLSEILSWGLIDLVWGTLMMIGISIVMLVVNFKLALITLSVVPFITIIAYKFRKEILKSYREVRKLNSKITGLFNEGITGAKTSKTLRLEEKHVSDFEGLTNNMRRKSIRAGVISALFFPVVLITGYIGTSLALNFGGNDVLTGTITIGTLVLFVTYSTQFFEPVLQIARILAELQQAQASAERVIQLLETEPDLYDSQQVKDKYGEINNPNFEVFEDLQGDLKIENVDFSYDDGEMILKDFNLEVNKGETIALVGPTGAGKSTIIKLIARFFEPTSGRILIDGVDYKERSITWLHKNLGYVLQDPHLFSGSIIDNIRYGRLDATDEEVHEAAKIVSADSFINKLEKGYDTEVGEGGAKLSTGEKQLISFARAILADPKILILDEATSSIDTETEQLIQNAINALLKDRTSFIIAHRLSTIVNADRILVIEEGTITESGNHEELLETKGHYHQLYSNQFKTRTT